jgi:DNA invertase Pin-like site-specific DNA recombinase
MEGFSRLLGWFVIVPVRKCLILLLDMKRAAIYLRISRDPLHDELGVRRQERDCVALCQREGLEVIEVLTDDDKSAYTGKKRPAYERLLELIKEGEIASVVAWHPDRLTRHPRELEDLIDLLDRSKVTVRTVQAGLYDLATPSGRMTARIVGNVARHESEHKSARLQRKHLELAQHGKVSGGGTRPFGFAADRVTIDPAEAAVIREAAQRLLAGETLYSVCNDLNGQGLRASSGGEFTQQNLRRIMIAPRTAGLRTHKTGTYTAVWNGIISAEDHQRLVVLLTDPARVRNRHKSRYLLTGTARCGVCGAALIARPTGKHVRSMVCTSPAVPGSKGCGKIRIMAEPVEDLVLAALFTRLNSPALGKALAENVHDDTEDLAELQRIETMIEELAEDWAAGNVDRTAWLAASKRLQERREEVGQRVRAALAPSVLDRYAGVEGALSQAWPKLGFDQQRAVIRAAVASVVIASGVKGLNRFDPRRVSIVWRV